MATPLTAFAAALRALPAGTLVTLPREGWLALVDESPAAEEAGTEAGGVDGTVAEVAQRFGRAPSTVRGWLDAGVLHGYKLFGREWRIPAASVTAFQAAQRGVRRATPPDLPASSLDTWRAHVRGAAGRSP